MAIAEYTKCITSIELRLHLSLYILCITFPALALFMVLVCILCITSTASVYIHHLIQIYDPSITFVSKKLLKISLQDARMKDGGPAIKISPSTISETTGPWQPRRSGCEVVEPPQKSSLTCPGSLSFSIPFPCYLRSGAGHWGPPSTSKRKGCGARTDPTQLPWQRGRAPSRRPWASTSQSSGNISSGFSWAWARLQRAICWVFTIHHLPCHHPSGADAAGQPDKHIAMGPGPAGGLHRLAVDGTALPLGSSQAKTCT